jgi:hypothetical protein
VSIKLRSGTTRRDIPLQPQLLYRFLRHLRRPARDSSALLIIVFATLLSVSLRAGPYGLYGLPMTLLLVSWFFKYAFVLFDHVVHGFDEPPTLDICMVNPFDEQRPLVQLAIIAGISAGVRAVAISISPIASSVLADDRGPWLLVCRFTRAHRGGRSIRSSGPGRRPRPSVWPSWLPGVVARTRSAACC